MKIGLFFGSFNPIHVGHMVVANYIKEFTDLDKVWFVVSPQNPFKKKADLLEDDERLEMVTLATEGQEVFEASSVEFNLPKPSYTIDTLECLQKQYSQHSFKLIMGSDNLLHFHKWKNFEGILENYELLVYPRPNYEVDNLSYGESVKIVNAPMMEISSTLIRQMFTEGKKPCFFLAPKVYEYIVKNGFYETVR